VFPSLNDISCISLSTFHQQKTREVIRQGHEIPTTAEYSLQKRSVVKKNLFIYLNKKLTSSFPPSDAVGLGSRVGSRQWDIFHCNTISFALPVDLGQVNGRLVAVR
jgi:hypothetical protein